MEYATDIIQDTVRDLIYALYEKQSFSTAADFNIFEAQMKKIWETVSGALEDVIDVHQAANDVQLLEDRCAELRSELDHAEDEKQELADRNFDLTEENEKLKEMLNKISKVVNDTWS
jgi:predicted  nucleic acid-binding Zn-ribbon protein